MNFTNFNYLKEYIQWWIFKIHFLWGGGSVIKNNTYFKCYIFIFIKTNI